LTCEVFEKSLEDETVPIKNQIKTILNISQEIKAVIKIT